MADPDFLIPLDSAVPDSHGFIAFLTEKHQVREMERGFLFNDPSPPLLTVGACMSLDKIDLFNDPLFLFRQNLNRIISRIEDDSIRKREVNEYYSLFSTFEDTLIDVRAIIGRKGDFVKSPDPLSAELLLNSIANSFDKLKELIDISDEKELEWKREITVGIVKRCTS